MQTLRDLSARPHGTEVEAQTSRSKCSFEGHSAKEEMRACALAFGLLSAELHELQSKLDVAHNTLSQQRAEIDGLENGSNELKKSLVELQEVRRRAHCTRRYIWVPSLLNR